MMRTITRSLAILLVLVSACGGATASTLRQLSDIDRYASAADAAGAGETLFFQQDATTPAYEPKSAWGGVWRSLVFPGWGEHYLGATGAASVFFVAEAVIWGSYIVFETQGYLRENDYKDYAGTFAGVTTTGHSDDYYSLLTQYNSAEDYEADIKSEGRAILYPDADAATLEQYWLSNRVSDFEEWTWQAVEYRRAYQETRASSKRSYRRGTYAIALAVANRVVSAIYAVKVARDLERDAQTSLYLEIGPPRYHPGAGAQTGASIVRRF